MAHVVCVRGSGDILPLQVAGPSQLPVSRPGPQHDERRLRLVHVLASARRGRQYAVDSLRRNSFRLSSPSFLRSQAGPTGYSVIGYPQTDTV